MHIGHKTDPLSEYEGENHFIVLPITQFVRKDGGLAVIHSYTKEVFNNNPTIEKYWGYLVNSGVFAPVFRRTGAIFLGLPDRKHYASKLSEELVELSLIYLAEIASEEDHNLFYLPADFGEDKAALLDSINHLNNVVVLEESAE